MSAILRRAVPLSASLRSTAALRVAGVRAYSEGSTARDPGWSKKEKAVEDQYAHNREVEAIKKMQAELEAKQKELDQREKSLEQREKKAGQ